MSKAKQVLDLMNSVEEALTPEQEELFRIFRKNLEIIYVDCPEIENDLAAAAEQVIDGGLLDKAGQELYDKVKADLGLDFKGMVKWAIKNRNKWF